MFFRFDNTKMRYVRVDLRPFVLSIAIIISLFAFLYSIRTKIKQEKIYIEGEMIVKVKGSSFSPSALLKYIKICGIRHADIVFAQAVLESGNFKSKRFLESNNLFGLKIARSRPSTSCYEYKDHCGYNTWQLSVQDYALFQSAYLKDLTSRNDYLSYLDRNYAEDSAYINKINSIIAKNKRL